MLPSEQSCNAHIYAILKMTVFMYVWVTPTNVLTFWIQPQVFYNWYRNKP